MRWNQRLFDHDDLEGVVRIFTHEQGGRVNAPSQRHSLGLVTQKTTQATAFT
ncbi:MAG: hypothetical protein R3C28_18720 [Pirellulaceae bacterium]